MRPPCEVVVKKVLPAIRSILVQELSDRHDMSQTEIADSLGITQPAVSQYLGSSRGSSDLIESLKDAGLYSELQSLSDEIANGNPDKPQIIEKYCKVCESMGKEEILCVLHVEDAPYLSNEECNACLGSKEK